MDALVSAMKTVESGDAKARLDMLLAEIAEMGEPITITERGRPVAMLTAVSPRRRRFGQLPALSVPENFDDPPPGLESSVPGGNSRTQLRFRPSSPTPGFHHCDVTSAKWPQSDR